MPPRWPFWPPPPWPWPKWWERLRLGGDKPPPGPRANGDGVTRQDELERIYWGMVDDLMARVGRKPEEKGGRIRRRRRQSRNQ